MNHEETIRKIHEIISYLQANASSNDVNDLSIKLNELSVHAVYFAEHVTDAFALMNNSEDAYKTAVAGYISESTLPAAKSEREAETKFANLRKEFLDNKNLQRKFSTKLDRIDKVLDHFKQRISVINKMEGKHL